VTNLKAAVLEKLNSPLEIRELELSELTNGQVLVRVIVSGICGSQLHEIRGNKGNGKFLPHLMGHEGCGIVNAVGLGVTTVKVGDKVVMHWRPGLGIESDFPTYFLNGKPISSGRITTLNEFAIVSENRVTKVPLDTPPEVAAILGCALTTALGIIDNQANIRFGESVAVIGCGGVGLNLLQGSKLKGASQIIAIDTNKKKELLCRAVGAHEFYASIDEFPGKIDLIIDTTGKPEIIAKAFSIMAGSGRLILVGQPEPEESIVLENALQFFSGAGQSIRATQGGETVPQIDIPKYLRLFYSGQLQIDILVTHRFKLDQINDAIELLKTGDAGRIMIEISGDCK
jgi:Zn-dependent alcohol dehydrogenase